MDKLEKLKQEIKHELLHLNIQHATLEIETRTFIAKKRTEVGVIEY
jgi:hypothetical protein